MNKSAYYVVKEIGTFSDEIPFKKKYMSIINKDKKRYKEVIAIENTVEPGMPDLLLIDSKDKASFIEVKYARKGIISFEKTQIPWYRRHSRLPIEIIAYNDITHNIHVINVIVVLSQVRGTKYKLEREEHYALENLL